MLYRKSDRLSSAEFFDSLEKLVDVNAGYVVKPSAILTQWGVPSLQKTMLFLCRCPGFTKRSSLDKVAAAA